MDLNDRLIQKASTEAIKTFGEEHELFVCVEEMSELTKEITKYLRSELSRDRRGMLVKEFVDVAISLVHIKNIFGITDKEFAMCSKDKITRLEESIYKRLYEYKATETEDLSLYLCKSCGTIVTKDGKTKEANIKIIKHILSLTESKFIKYVINTECCPQLELK